MVIGGLEAEMHCSRLKEWKISCLKLPIGNQAEFAQGPVGTTNQQKNFIVPAIARFKKFQVDYNEHRKIMKSLILKMALA